MTKPRNKTKIQANVSNEYPPRTVVVDGQPLVESLEMIMRGEANHIVQAKSPTALIENKLAESLQTNTKAVLTNPCAHFLGTNHFERLEVRFSNKSDKPLLHASLDEFLVTLPERVLQESLHTILEELFMNSVYDAPREAKKQNLSVRHPNRSARLVMAKSDQRFVLMSEDCYGSLRIDKWLKTLWRGHQEGQNRMPNMERMDEGAGLGSSIMLDLSVSLVTIVEPGVLSLVACILPLRTSSRQISTFGKNLHIIEYVPSKKNKE